MSWLERLWYGQHPARWLLWPVSLIYRAGMALRRWSYRVGLCRIVELPVPVVVVGNISVGGTGKTPCTIWLAQQLTAAGFSVGIVSRGYGGRARVWPQAVDGASDPSQVGDEPVVIARRTGCPVQVGPDRVAAARALLARAAVDVLLADDGLQHLRLGRRCEIAVVDGERGLGNGLCLPAGPLREPPGRLRRVDAVLLNHGRGHCMTGAFRASLRPTAVIRLDGAEQRPLEAFRGQSVYAVAGIGHPERFFALLEQAGLQVQRCALRDHAAIDPTQLPAECPVLMTEKDAIKYTDSARGNIWYLAVDLCFEADDETRLLDLVLARLRN